MSRVWKEEQPRDEHGRAAGLSASPLTRKYLTRYIPIQREEAVGGNSTEVEMAKSLAPRPCKAVHRVLAVSHRAKVKAAKRERWIRRSEDARRIALVGGLGLSDDEAPGSHLNWSGSWHVRAVGSQVRKRVD